MNAENKVFLELYREDKKNMPDMRSISAFSLGMPDDVFNYALQKLKKEKIFISHASQDSKYVKALVELIEAIGVSEEGIFCSSLPGYGIPLGRDIYAYIREQFLEYRVKVCYIFSDNFYHSVAYLSELGIVDLIQLDYFQIFIPGFDLSHMKGALCPNKIGIKLDDDIAIIGERLREMRDDLTAFFHLPRISESKWERKRNEFIYDINHI